eukprot:scaffold43996_cov24-Tisochrysis_lutea.AAC.3
MAASSADASANPLFDDAAAAATWPAPSSPSATTQAARGRSGHNGDRQPCRASSPPACSCARPAAVVASS